MLAKKQAGTGAPLWALTYGDLMTLLLCFFILLAAFADYDKGGSTASSSMVAAMQSIQLALGLPVRQYAANANAAEFNALVERVSKAVQNQNSAHRNDSVERGIVGKSFRLRRIRDGMEITIGGPVHFEPFSREPTEEGRKSIQQLGGLIKGHRNKLDIVGHAADRPVPADWGYADAIQLSYERALFVAEELISMGVDPRTIRLTAAADNEPVGSDQEERGQPGAHVDNRRVEIIVRESQIDDYQSERPAQRSSSLAVPKPATGPTTE